MPVKYLVSFLVVTALAFHLGACASSEDNEETQIDEIVQDLDEPTTVFQDSTEIFVERIREEDTIVVGVIIDEENLMAPHDRQPGVAFVG